MVEAATISAGVILVVAGVALALAAVTLAAQRRSADRRLLFVGLAFLVFSLKDGAVAAVLVLHGVPHDVLWGFDAALDLLAFGLLGLPLLMRR